MSLTINVRSWIKGAGDTAGDAIELDGRPGCQRSQRRRCHPDKVTDASGRLEHPPAREAEMFDRRPNAADNRLAGVVGVDCRGAGRIQLVGREQIGERLAPLLPSLDIAVAGPLIEHGLGERTPSDIANQRFALRLGGRPVFIA